MKNFIDWFKNISKTELLLAIACIILLFFVLFPHKANNVKTVIKEDTHKIDSLQTVIDKSKDSISDYKLAIHNLDEFVKMQNDNIVRNKKKIADANSSLDAQDNLIDSLTYKEYDSAFVTKGYAVTVNIDTNFIFNKYDAKRVLKLIDTSEVYSKQIKIYQINDSLYRLELTGKDSIITMKDKIIETHLHIEADQVKQQGLLANQRDAYKGEVKKAKTGKVLFMGLSGALLAVLIIR